MIFLDDPDTWPAHEDDGTGDHCVPDCERCQLLVLAERREFDIQELIDAGASGEDAEIHAKMIELVTPMLDPPCHVFASDGTCIYCGAFAPGTPDPDPQPGDPP